MLLRIKLLPLRQHLYVLRDAPCPGLGLFGVLDPVQDRVPVGAVERLEELAGAIVLLQLQAQVAVIRDIVMSEVLPDPFGQVVVLQVEDTGPGIAPAEREAVFRPFYRTFITRDGTASQRLARLEQSLGPRIAEVGRAPAAER